ncbi:hypothetical protein MNBD_GAMMA25-540 [hydrothermal vent metagenome]|uniref:Ice-binding protein C-terminal domain-containing protein n=1 Tax=hydrothermal vent metagenome TaxID=652676 RepID=A0A3B1AQX7_9ZZZZ
MLRIYSRFILNSLILLCSFSVANALVIEDASARVIEDTYWGSEDHLDASRYIFRNGQEVQRGTDGTALSGSSVNLSNAGYGGYIEYNILLSSLGAINGDIGLKWGMTCANDTIEGVYHHESVPEPGTFLLVGIGLLGMLRIAQKP